MKQLTVYQRITEIIYLSKKGAFTFKEIQQKIRKLFEGQGIVQKYSIRTFQRDLIEIRDMHGIDIKFNKRMGLYEVNEEYSSPVQLKMLDSFDVIRSFQFQQGLDKVVFFDQMKASGIEHLSSLVYAIKMKLMISFYHHPGWQQDGVPRKICPLALKEFRNTWYLVGLNEHSQLRNYGLDRIQDLRILSSKFDYPPSIDIEEYYKDVFGILNDPNETVEEIVLSFSVSKGNYIKSKPIHPSQTILADSSDELKISLALKSNPDFIAELLSFGPSCLVLKPQRLRVQLRDILTQMLKKIEYGS
jgi:predicted DNA-binding transcriptional regulator YafY